MKRVLLALCFVILGANLAFAQAGSICLFADPDGNTCSITDSIPGLLSVFVVHQGTTGATAAQFMAPTPACMIGATYLSDTSPYPVTIGNSQTGVSIGYGACLVSPIHLLTINYFANGTSADDCAFSVVPDPAAAQGTVIIVDCLSQVQEAVGGTTYVNSMIPCDCPAGPSNPPVLSVSPDSLIFGDTDSLLALQITNLGEPTLTWNVTRGAFWIDVTPSSGTENGTVTVTVDRTGLAVGDYASIVTVTSNGGAATIPVTMSVVDNRPPLLSVSPLTLDYGTTATLDDFGISNAGGGVLTWNITEAVPWINILSPTSGSGNAIITVEVDRTGLVPGFYSGLIDVTSNAGNETVTVNMQVPVPTPILGFSPASLTFDVTTGSLPLDVFNSGTGDLNWSIASSEPWLTATPTSGTNDVTVTVTVDRTGLPDSTYSGMLTITSNGGNGTVPVLMNVATNPILSVNPLQLVFNLPYVDKTFQIQNVGVGTLNWTITASEAWILVTPPLTGSGDKQVSVRIDGATVPPGQQSGNVTVDSNGGTQVVQITYNPIPAFGGALGIYADQNGANCEILDFAPGLLTVYVVHQNTPGATAAQFSAPMPSCMTGAIWLSDSGVWPVTIGNSQTGIAVAYGACLSAPITVLAINYFAVGTSQTCCEYLVLPDPNVLSGEIEVVGCSNNLLFVPSSVAYINTDGTCFCNPVKVEESTWGRVKALYAPPPATNQR